MKRKIIPWLNIVVSPIIILIVYFAIVLFILWAISVVAILGIWIMGLRIAAIVCILILRRITERLWSDLVKS